MTKPETPIAAPSINSDSLPWWKVLNRCYHSFVFIVTSLAWLFDCLDQQLFILARNNAISTLLGTGADPLIVKKYGGYATAIFVAGWATGRLIFGSIGDRIRAHATSAWSPRSCRSGSGQEIKAPVCISIFALKIMKVGRSPDL